MHTELNLVDLIVSNGSMTMIPSTLMMTANFKNGILN
jgi:hypothetical protein